MMFWTLARKRGIPNKFCLCKIDPPRKNSANTRNQFPEIDNTLLPKFCDKAESNLLIDFYQNLTWYLFN